VGENRTKKNSETCGETAQVTQRQWAWRYYGSTQLIEGGDNGRFGKKKTTTS